MSNIHPIFEQLLSRKDKEEQLQQQAKVIWFTGLSGSGKSTIAHHLEKQLHEKGFFTMVLDGDNVRSGINNNVGFSDEDRKENIRRIAEVSRLFLNCGVISINCFVSPVNELRTLAKDIIGVEDFIEVYINAPLEICEERDVKGLYKKARAGEIRQFTGISDTYEPPENAEIILPTGELSPTEAADRVIADLKTRGVIS